MAKSRMLTTAAATLLLGGLVGTGCAWLTQQGRQAPAPAPAAEATAAPVPAVPVAELWRMPDDPATAEAALRAALARARAERLPVAVVGARHSLGGQAFAPGGLLIDMRPHHAMRLDAKTRTLHVGAGARWREVLAYLNPLGVSPEVMPPYGDFTVGGSLSVNGHGGLAGKGPMAASVTALRVMLADGRVLRCTRQVHGEVFRAVLGGYGLIGVILDAELRVVPNERYRVQRHFLRAEGIAQGFAAHGGIAPEVGLAQARLSVAPRSFLREAILTVYRRVPGPAPARPLPEPAALEAAKQRYLRDAVGSAEGKAALWEAERRADAGLLKEYATRNELLSDSAARYAAGELDGEAVLQEYFLPRQMLGAYLEFAREVIAERRGELLEATVREVRRDVDTTLRYADQDMFALGLVFHQPEGAQAEQAMTGLSQALVDGAIALKGRHFLPYRLHATLGQFHRAYPWAPGFFALKAKYDPEARFQNQLYLKYAPRE